jgi:hypothetical protein
MHHIRQTAAQLYENLLHMYRHAFASQRFEVAYHLLAAALHSAEEAENQDWLIEVEMSSKEGQAEIDRAHPDSAISSTSSGARGNVALFTALAATAAAMRGKLIAQEALERRRELDPRLPDRS